MLSRFFSTKVPVAPKGSMDSIQKNKEMSKAAVLRELNRILAACGVNRFLSSTNIYQKPSLIHVIALEDLRFICKHRTLLLRSNEVTCDFRSLSVILWSMLQDGDRVLNEVLHGGRAVGCLSSSSGSHWWNESSFSAKEKESIINTLERTAYVAIALTTLLFPYVREEIKENIVVGAEDVERTISLAEKLNQLYLNVALAIEGSVTHTPSTGTIPQYDASTHILFIEVESCYLQVQQLLVELPRRPVADIEIILKEMYRPEVWEASGLSLRSTAGFAAALQQLVISTAYRHRDVGGLSAALARIVQHRLLRRPPYRHHPFRLSYQRLEANPSDNDFFFIEPTFGMLKQFWTVKTGLERILCPGSLWFPLALNGTEAVLLSSEEKNALRAVSKATRINFLAQAKKIQSEGKRLSYHQLIGYALFEGMPGTDLTALGDLILRAQTTNLIAMDASAPFLTDPKYKWGEFLRLLTAICFTVRTDAGVGILGGDGRVLHDPIPLSSVIPLLDSLAEFIFQEPQFQQQVTITGESKTGKSMFPFCSPFTIEDSLYIHPMLNLISSHEVLIHVGRTKSGNSHNSSSEAVEVVQKLQARLESLVSTIYNACAKVQRELKIGGQNLSLKALQKRIPFLAFNRYRRIIELSTVVIRRAIQVATVQAVFPHSLLTAVLDTSVRLFAVYNLQIIKSGPSPSKEQEKQLTLFADLLRFIPSVMKVQDVNALFLERLVSLAGPILQSSGFDEDIAYCRLEGYLTAFSTATAAYVITDENFLEHWAEVGTTCMTKIPDTKYMSVVKAAHDFYIAGFLSKRCLAPLLMPTFLTVMMPAKWNEAKYRTPKLELVKHFAASLRYVCQCIMECDGEKLRRQIEDSNSILRQMVAKVKLDIGPTLPVVPIPSSAMPEADGSSPPTVTSPLQRITPTNVVLLVVSSLFDKICRLLHAISISQKGVIHISTADLIQSFILFLSALANQLQVSNVEIFPRVCASLEAVLLEHMKAVPHLRSLSLKGVGVIVAQTKGPLKKDAAEWYLNLSQKMHEKKLVSKL